MKERSNKSSNCFESSIFRRNNILKDILFGPEVLELREDMMLAIFSLSGSSRNIVLLISFKRQSEKCLCEDFMFFYSFIYREKVTIKGICKIIKIGYSITIFKGKYRQYTRCYGFQRNQGLDFFLCVLNIIPISFKIYIRVSMDKVDRWFLYFLWLLSNFSFSIESFLLMKFASNLFFTDIHFYKPNVIQSLQLIINLYLLIFSKDGQVSNNMLIVSKYILIELLALNLSVFTKSSQSTEKQSRIKLNAVKHKGYVV